MQDPIFKGYSVPNPEPGYPGGIFDPFGFSKVLIAGVRSCIVNLDHEHRINAAQKSYIRLASHALKWSR